MNSKTVCPPDCPGRYPGCGAKCKTFLDHRAECLARYKRNAEQVQIGNVLRPHERFTHRKK
jgi:hypothetical protein